MAEKRAAIDWNRTDGTGCHYGFYRGEGRATRIDIILPGHGNPLNRGKDFKIAVDGEGIGSKPTLEAAKAFAVEHFTNGNHRKPKAVKRSR